MAVAGKNTSRCIETSSPQEKFSNAGNNDFEKPTRAFDFVALFDMKERVTGVWRTYKAFFFSGKIEHHHCTKYVEIAVDDEGNFILSHAHTKRNVTVYSGEQWRIEPLKGRWYLYFGKKQAYEIITLETEYLVIADVVKGEKLFFAKMPGWYQRIEPVITSIRHINPEKESKQR